jgi:lipoate-protein ligase B
MPGICHVHQLGLVPFAEAWALQNQLAGEIGSGNRPPTLLLLEHPHTYTFGRSGKVKNLLWDEKELSSRGIAVHWIDRGGDVTYHGPGQLVGYPLLPLGAVNMHPQDQQSPSHIPQADYIAYLRKIEAALISTLRVVGVSAKQYPGYTGVWIPPADIKGFQVAPSEAESRPTKIAAVGIKVDAHGVSRHGFALNVNPDMSYWEGIVGCGLSGYDETSLGMLLGNAPSMDTLIKTVTESFGEEFDYSMKTKAL